MPRNAKAKREARARKTRSGESYATARMHTFEEGIDVPTREQLWDRFTKELDDHPTSSKWEFLGLRSHWRRHSDQLYKLVVRRNGCDGDWWWFEDDISVMPPDFPDSYRDLPPEMRPTGELRGLLAFAAESETRLGYSPPAVHRAIAEVRQRLLPLSQKAGRTPTLGRVESVILALLPMAERSEREGAARRFEVEDGLSPGSGATEAFLASPTPAADLLEKTLFELDDETRLKVLAIMYCGHDNEPDVKRVYYEILPRFVVNEGVVSQMVQKVHLVEHLRDGLDLARGASIDLDDPWPFVPKARAANPAGADRRWLRAYGGELAKDAAMVNRLGEVARAARRGDREGLTVLARGIRADYGDEGFRVARVAADAEGHKARDGGYVLAAVRDAFEHAPKVTTP
jgi:hypothetical protein